MKKLFKRGLLAVESTACTVALSANVFAGKNKDLSKVTGGLKTLEDLVLAIVGGVGVIILAWGLVDFGTAVASHETSQQMQGIKKAIAGLVVIAVPTLIKILS